MSNLIDPTRRGFLAALGTALVAAPAVIRLIDLMPVKVIPPPPLVVPEWITTKSFKPTAWVTGLVEHPVDTQGFRSHVVLFKTSCPIRAPGLRMDARPGDILEFDADGRLVPDGCAYATDAVRYGLKPGETYHMNVYEPLKSPPPALSQAA